MYLRKCRKIVDGAEYAYWQLVESCRTERGPRQRVVAYLGDVREPLRLGIAEAARGNDGVYQESLLAENIAPEWVEVDASRVRVERVLDFGAYWLGLQLIDRLGLLEALDSLLEKGREDIPWSVRSALRPTSWCVSSRTSFGKPWLRCARRLGLGMSRGK